MRFLHDRTSNTPTERDVQSALPLHQPAVVPQFGNQEYSPIKPPKKRRAEQEVIMQEFKNIVSSLASNRDELNFVNMFYFARRFFIYLDSRIPLIFSIFNVKIYSYMFRYSVHIGSKKTFLQ